MLNFLKKSPKKPEKPPVKVQKSWFQRLQTGLGKTRHAITDSVRHLLQGKLDDKILQEIEDILLSADVGIDATHDIIDSLNSKKHKLNADTPLQALETILTEKLNTAQQPFSITDKPTVILMVGINGTGKTTSIGKIAHWFKAQGKSVMLAAGDTFRAAAIDQLAAWGERNAVPVVKQQPGADSASVIFDAYQAAKAKNIDILLADTAGRLHTQSHLMEELKKVVRVLKKIDDAAPHEIWQVMDATTGQNGLKQAKAFHEALNLTGVILTKLDGTAKGGIIFSLTNALQLPIPFIGVGEGIDDCRPFDAQEFVKALFASEHSRTST